MSADIVRKQVTGVIHSPLSQQLKNENLQQLIQRIALAVKNISLDREPLSCQQSQALDVFKRTPTREKLELAQEAIGVIIRSRNIVIQGVPALLPDVDKLRRANELAVAAITSQKQAPQCPPPLQRPLAIPPALWPPIPSGLITSPSKQSPPVPIQLPPQKLANVPSLNSIVQSPLIQEPLLLSNPLPQQPQSELQHLISELGEILQGIDLDTESVSTAQRDQIIAFRNNPSEVAFNLAQEAIKAVIPKISVIKSLRLGIPYPISWPWETVNRTLKAFNALPPTPIQLPVNDEPVIPPFNPVMPVDELTVPILGILKYTWTFSDRKLHLYEHDGTPKLWLVDSVTQKRSQQTELLQYFRQYFIRNLVVPTTPRFIHCLKKGVFTNGVNGIQYHPAVATKTWKLVDGKKIIELVQVGNKFIYRVLDKAKEEVTQTNLPTLENSLNYYPIIDGKKVVPILLRTHKTWNLNGQVVDLVRGGDNVFFQTSDGTVTIRWEPIKFLADSTVMERLSRSLTLEPIAIVNGTLNFEESTYLFTWKGETTFTLSYKENNILTKIAKKEGETITTLQASVPLPANTSLEEFLLRFLGNEPVLAANGQLSWNPSNRVHHWVVDNKHVKLIRRPFIKDGLQKEELHFISCDLTTHKTVRGEIPRNDKSIEAQIETIKGTWEPIVDVNSNVSRFSIVCKAFPAIQGKQTNLIQDGEHLFWRVMDVDTTKTERIELDFAKDFSQADQISYLKNQIFSEGFPLRQRSQSFFDFQAYRSTIKGFLLQKVPTETIENVQPVWSGQSHKTWAHSQESPTVFEFEEWKPDIRVRYVYTSQIFFRLIKESQGLKWAIHDPATATVKRFPFDFNELMGAIPLATRRIFAEGFKVVAFDPVQHQVTTKIEKAQSVMDPTKTIDSDVWAVTFMSVGELQLKQLHNGHGEIYIEGIQRGNPFMYIADIGFRPSPESVLEEVRAATPSGAGTVNLTWIEDPTNDPKRQRPRNERKGPTWLRERSSIEALLEAICKDITEQKADRIRPFNITGGQETVINNIINVPLMFLNILTGFRIGFVGDGKSVNCVEWDKEKLRYAGIRALPKTNIAYSSPEDYLTSGDWEQTAQSLRGRDFSRISNPLMISIPLAIPFTGIWARELDFDISQAIQDKIGDHQWSPIGLVGQLTEWKIGGRDQNYQHLNGEQVIFSVLIRGENAPRLIDITEYIRSEFPKVFTKKIKDIEIARANRHDSPL